MEMFAFVSAVRGYHVYQEVFTPSIGEKLVAKRELTTPWTNKKGIVSCISRTRDFWPKTLAKRCGLYTSLYGNRFTFNIDKLTFESGFVQFFISLNACLLPA